MDVFMRDSDAFSWYMERDPALRSTVVAIAWLEGSPDWDVLVAKLEAATRLIPMFRQRIVDVPGRLAPPRWTIDDRFDLTWHLRRMDSPFPHTPATVLTLARNAAMTGFDPSHPLWEFTLVEHLERGRARLVMKLHHSLTDGLGGMQLALLLYDTEATVAPVPQVDLAEGERLGVVDVVRESVVRDLDRALGIVASGARSAAPAALRSDAPPGGERQRCDGDRVVHRAHGRAATQDAFADHEGAQPGPSPRDLRGAAGRSEEGSDGRWRQRQRRVHGRGDGRLAQVPRAPRSSGQGAASHHAHQRPDPGRPDRGKPDHPHAVPRPDLRSRSRVPHP